MKVKNAVVTIGNFDGVHRGHQELIEAAKSKAKKISGEVVVVTFDPHPMKVLAPHKSVKRIFPLKDEIEQMGRLGISKIVVENFTKDLAQMTPEDFIREKIKDVFAPKALVVGYDFSFGKDRRGTPAFLLEKSKDFGFEVEVVPAFKVSGTIVSSTEIRKKIEAGLIDEANEFLGRNFYLEGKIVAGAGRGRGLGIPTANLEYDSEIFPKLGVYVSQSYVNEKKYFSVTNVGNNPTFTSEIGAKPKVETFILDFNDDIYGKDFRLDLLDFLRPEIKFNGIQELKAQIQKDIGLTREWFNTHGT